MYVLVTDFKTHWDKNGNKSSYPVNFIRCKDLKEDTESVFIKKDKSGKITNAWKGSVTKIINNGNDRTVFEFNIENKLNPSEYKKYNKYNNGWHEISNKAPEENIDGDILLPKFYELIGKGWIETADFEDYVYFLLRLLGIHRAYKIPGKLQSGQPDGFFRISNLAVIYDCTLRPDYTEMKNQQINNFCSQLLSGSINLPDNITESTSDCQKQVWIITRQKTKLIRTLRNKDIVTVKEIAIDDIKDLYIKRLSDALSEQDLENCLKTLGGS